MSSDDRENLVLFEETAGHLGAKEVRASSDVVGLDEAIAGSSLVINWISPHQIAEESSFGDLPEPINLLYIFKLNILLITLLS